MCESLEQNCHFQQRRFSNVPVDVITSLLAPIGVLYVRRNDALWYNIHNARCNTDEQYTTSMAGRNKYLKQHMSERSHPSF